MDYCIRSARAEDARELSEIYRYYVENTAVTFEYEPPTETEFLARIENASKRYPYLCIEGEDGLLGFAFAHHFRARPAYDYGAEVTIYLRRDCRHLGLGRAIYTVLEQELGRMGVRILYACIAVPDGEDKQLSMDSPRFHEALGYRVCGEFRRCGYKLGKWYTMVWMEKVIGEFPEKPAPLLPYPAVLENSAPLTRPLTAFNEKTIRLVTDSGDVFFGEAERFSDEYAMHEYGREEEGLQIGAYLDFKSDIASVELI